MWASHYPCIWFSSSQQKLEVWRNSKLSFYVGLIQIPFDRKFISIPLSTSPFSWWVWFENGEVDKGIETNFLSKWNLNLTNIKRKFRVSPHFQFWWLELNHMQGYWLAHIVHSSWEWWSRQGDWNKFSIKWNLNQTNIKRKFRVSPHFQFWWLELNHMQGYWLAHIENYTYITM